MFEFVLFMLAMELPLTWPRFQYWIIKQFICNNLRARNEMIKNGFFFCLNEIIKWFFSIFNSNDNWSSNVYRLGGATSHDQRFFFLVWSICTYNVCKSQNKKKILFIFRHFKSLLTEWDPRFECGSAADIEKNSDFICNM